MTASRQGFIAFDGSQTSEIASKYEPDLVCVCGEALFDGSAEDGAFRFCRFVLSINRSDVASDPTFDSVSK